MRRLLELLGDPQSKYPIVHVAGTKGKGSTSHFIASLLKAGGLKVGLYTSPHLLKLEERIRIAGKPCSADELVMLVDQMRGAARELEMEGAGRATFFELTTAMGMLHFAKKRVDAAVIEVGLGGRLDSTNVCTPVVSVITAIGIDHQAQLGGTIAEIASEKAGIIKPRVPVVCSARDQRARTVIEQRASELDCPLRLINRDFEVAWQASPENQRPLRQFSNVEFSPAYSESYLGNSHWQLSMLGSHQADNAGAALATIDWLQQRGWILESPRFGKALAATQIPARVQIVGQKPMQIIDVAHNLDSMRATVRTLEEHFSKCETTFVFASSRDKDYRAMLRSIIERCNRLIITQYHKNPRALPVNELYQIALEERQSLGLSLTAITAIASPIRAWKSALKKTAPDGLVIATGSFFLAAELLSQ